MNNIVLIGPNYVYREDVEGGKLIGFSCKIYWPGFFMIIFYLFIFMCLFSFSKDYFCVASLKITSSLSVERRCLLSFCLGVFMELI